MRYLISAAVLTLVLAGCGGASDADQKKAEDYCGSAGAYRSGGMELDKYTAPDGFDRCVEDVLKVLDCIDITASKAGGGFVPRNCDDGGFLPLDG